ncbi:transcriptional regulator, TetR family [Catenulispora acidiphila DSM 44928]|uniref:Transcriptional regulator, TetR family n=1 Tax=Catenulispora acidiphila (strain DSM 44928 / JCM 14897 / NBRC 102108 / NRRL B-24433 / ID139908) TaxID=479433 RepID=C7PXM2_CATAD|nr:TetR family transcriptional regulator [Catenulispora acidiphila]ACU71475.1 transcriptional regulator, TetR family [Catenulispora acidiphila DSM 44928]
MTTPQFERARSAEAKQAREAAILEAAARLALEHGIRTVTLTDIAEAVGMHKSAMLRYFETREDIFLQLATTAWREWSASVRDQLARLSAGTGRGARRREWEQTAGEVAAALASSLVSRPLFCDLLAHTPLNLERNVSVDRVRAFKILAIAEVAAIAATLSTITPLSVNEATSVVTTATAMAGALWQMAAPRTTLRTLYESDPDLAHAVVDVEPRLTDILSALITGYAARSSP